MRIATRVVQMLVRLGGLTQLVLGGLFWTGYQLQLIPIHMLVGFVVVLGLVVLAALGAVARVGWVRVVVALIWAPFVVWLGLNQATLLQGDWHWLVQVLHLAVGVAAIAQAESLAQAIKAGRASLRPL